MNLLQPQDKRSSQPGDSAAAVEARSRFLDSGGGDALLATLRETVDALDLPEEPVVLDVGMGDGFFLAGLSASRTLVACGVDLSSAALSRAARRLPHATLVVANADRMLPWADASFDLALSITARRPAAELARVLRGEGRLVVVIPAEDDLVELREAVQGEGRRRDRVDGVVAELAAGFTLEGRHECRTRRTLSRLQIADALVSTYRGLRHSEQEFASRLDELPVTLASEVLVFRPRMSA